MYPEILLKLIILYDQSGNTEKRHKLSNQIKFKTSVLQSGLCNYSDAYLVVKGTINVTDPNNNAYDKKLAFENNAPVISCTTKINNAPIDNSEDLDLVMTVYNLIEQSKNYSKTTKNLWNYYRDEPNSGAAGDINYSIKD